MKNNKQLFDLINNGFETTIEIGLDESIRIYIEKEIENIIKKNDEAEELKKNKQMLQSHYELFMKKKEFIDMFKLCLTDIIKVIEFDPMHRIAVNCYTCARGVELGKKYGKPKAK